MGTLIAVSLLESYEEPEEELPWFHHIEAYLQDRTYPESATPDQRRSLRHMTNKYIIVGSTLFRRGFNGELLRCLTDDEAYKSRRRSTFWRLWWSREWPDVSKENPSTGLLLANHGRRLHEICSSLREVPTSRRQDSRTRIFSPSFVLTLAFLDVGI